MSAPPKEPGLVHVRPADCSSTVLLVHAPYPGRLRFDGLPSSLFSATAPLLQELSRLGISFGFMDPGSVDEEFYRALRRLLRGGAVRIILISTSTAAIEETARIARTVREESRSDVLVIVGGPHEDACAAKCAEVLPDVDISIAGDAEHVLFRVVVDCLDRGASAARLCSSLEGGRLSSDVLRGRGSITTRAWGTPFTRVFDFGSTIVESFHTRCRIERPVSFDVFPGRLTVPLTISRGCSYGRCTFCSEGGPGVRSQVVDAFDWVGALGRRHPNCALYFQDSIFPATTPVRRHLLPLLKELGITWGCQVYLPTLSRRLLRELATHGCTYLYTGIESGSDSVLQSIGKSALSRSTILERLGWFADCGMRAGLSLMFGALSEDGELLETRESIAETTSLAENLLTSGVPLAGFYPNIQTVLPGTVVHHGLARQGVELDFYQMPRAPEFAAFEDGAVGYNFLTIAPEKARERASLVEAINACALSLEQRCE